MPDQVIQFEGAEHHFPADFTEADIAKALKSSAPQPQNGIPKAPWGTFSSGPHKTFEETVGPETTLGRIAHGISNLSEYLPEEGAVLAVPAEGAIGTLAQRARNLAATLGAGAAVDWAAEKAGLPAHYAYPLGALTSITVGSRLSPEVAEAMRQHGRGWARGLLGLGNVEKNANAKPITLNGPIPGTAGPAGKVNRQVPTTGLPLSGTIDLPAPEPEIIPGTAGPSGIQPSTPVIGTVPSGPQVLSNRGTLGIIHPVQFTVASPALGTSTSMLDDIAKGMGERSYARATPERKAIIDVLASKIHTQAMPAPKPQATTIEPVGPSNPTSLATGTFPPPNPEGGLKIQGTNEAIKNRVAGRANMMEAHAVNKYNHLVDEMVKSKGITQSQFAAKPFNEQVKLVNEAIEKVQSKGKAGDIRFRNKTGKYGAFSTEPGYLGETRASMEAIGKMLPRSVEEYISPYGLTPPQK